MRLIDLVFERPKNDERTRSSDGDERISVCDKTELTTLNTPRPASNAQNGMHKKMKKLLSQPDNAFTVASAQAIDQSREIQNTFQR
jgi:hypothetical protein